MTIINPESKKDNDNALTRRKPKVCYSCGKTFDNWDSLMYHKRKWHELHFMGDMEYNSD